LRTDYLPKNTKAVFDYFCEEQLLQNFTLIGGTAMSLQVGHRLSEDLDFWLPSKELNKAEISSIIRNAQNQGFNAELAMSGDKLIAAKINGIDVLLYSQDYKINEVKVTFFARNDVPYQYFNQFDRLKNSEVSFGIMGLDGLFAMKSHVIHQRTKSRDLFDLHYFLNHGYTLEDIFRAAKLAEPACAEEYAKAVLLGMAPLDSDDEGLHAIGEPIEINALYEFFKDRVDSYERETLKEIRKELGAIVDGPLIG